MRTLVLRKIALRRCHHQPSQNVTFCTHDRERRATTRAHLSTSETPSAQQPSKCRIFDLRDGTVPYHRAWDLQHALVDELKQDPLAHDALILLEHDPVYTLGTASKLHNVLFPMSHIYRRDENLSTFATNIGAAAEEEALIVRTERGGEVTYHGPGQTVVYPILNLRRHRMDLHWYLRALEGVVISVLQDEYHLHGGRKDGLTGVWVDDQKVCAIGLKVSKWITMHGFALNVKTDLKPFKRIIPCGISTHGVSSLHLLTSDGGCQTRARQAIIRAFNTAFGPYEFSYHCLNPAIPAPHVESSAS